MSGRGDNNKHGSSGRGASNQSNQPLGNNDRAAGNDGFGRGASTEKGRTFDLLVDDVPYLVKARPFLFNEEQRFYVSVNDGPEHVFTWDSELKLIRAIDDEAGILPDTLEQEISERLQSRQD